MGLDSQASLKAAETIEIKCCFRSELSTYGYKVQKYVGDNGVYKSQLFNRELEEKGQLLDLCGVEAHHQNGVAERAIRTVSQSARSSKKHSWNFGPWQWNM
mmetsp:Transcript_18227/g.25730  ORF Transcript_18227/g.25730 Transcript_18227/m.25730 type:complete len:101 (-) Transcript_18227:2763-3065(-)